MFYLFFLILTLSFVRPHIGLLAIFSISLFFIFKNFFLSNSKNYIILFLLIFTLLISFSSTFGTFDLNKISKFIKIFANYITSDTSTQFPTELNYFTKILYYFFYPNIFIFKNINTYELIIIFENTILFLFFLKFFSFNKNTFKYAFLPFIFCFFL